MSLDIKNLFSSIPIKNVIEMIAKQWRKLYRHTKMSKDLFLRVLDFVLAESPVFFVMMVNIITKPMARE